MKRSLIAKSLGLGIVVSSSLLGCATDAPSDEEECLPGDIDCAPDDEGTGGKGDAFDFANDPERMAQRLNYRLAELPKTGKRTKPVWATQFPDAVGRAEVAWADTYWPTVEGGHNTRYQGANVKSPIEKYDAAFNNKPGCETQPDSTFGANAKAEWDEYKKCAGPATKWQITTFQNSQILNNGKDDDGDGNIDIEGDDGVDGMATWWGTCHAWAPASLMVPEPQQSVTVNGITFDPGDIKALTQNIYDQTSAVMVGGRCNAKEIKHGPDISANDPCADLNAGAMHVVIANFVGINNLALVEDRTANFEIWNQAVMGYDITKQDKVTASAANTCVGANGSTWTFNTSAKELFEVRMTVEYLTESGAERLPVGARNNIRTDRYHYILEIGSTGKILGGRYCTDSENNHVDFYWAPTTRFNPSNPNVSKTKVQELIAKSVARPGGGGGTGEGKRFTATPNASIPDNSTTGVTVDVPVTGVTGSVGLAVTVDIEHTWRGDLVVEVLKDGTAVKKLHDRTGGSADNLQQTFTLTAAEVGSSPNGRWSLRVVDTAAADLGTVKTVELNFQ
jgi:hypothetical protein